LVCVTSVACLKKAELVWTGRTPTATRTMPFAAKRPRTERKSGGGGQLMTDYEWESFWNTLDAQRRQPCEDDCAECAEEDTEEDLAPMVRQSDQITDEFEQPKYAPSVSDPRSRTSRFNRCGSCVACRAKDCGTCKNCLDKPRFGGPGIKKKACIARVCRALSQAKEESSEDEQGRDDDAASEETLIMPRSSSPCHLLTGLQQRRPLLPLETAQQMSAYQMLDALSRGGGMPSLVAT